VEGRCAAERSSWAGTMALCSASRAAILLLNMVAAHTSFAQPDLREWCNYQPIIYVPIDIKRLGCSARSLLVSPRFYLTPILLFALFSNNAHMILLVTVGMTLNAAPGVSKAVRAWALLPLVSH
jgi:hypothetical protein